MDYAAATMATYLESREPGTCRRAICRGSILIGAVCIRHPWLRGPYLELLAVLPGHQGAGIGAAILDWMAAEVTGPHIRPAPSGGGANSLWVCTSTFNSRALAFYTAHGFEVVGELDGLVAPGFSEILLRKRL